MITLYWATCCGMASIIHDRSYLRLALGASLVLGVLAFVSYRLVRFEVPESELIGTYERSRVPFLKVSHLPRILVLRPDGSMQLYGPEGEQVFSGAWRWDDRERVIRVDDRRWDRQIRLRSTLMGPRLSMRISTIALEEDHPEHDEEVDLVKVGADIPGSVTN